MRPLVALLSDFGIADSYVAEMHAAIVRRVPSARVMDVTHQVRPFDRVGAALTAERIVAQLPRGASLAIIVDPGVGTQRRRIFAERDGIWLVGPDNGSLPLRPGRDRTWLVRDTLLTPPQDVTTFDGREVFAPLAALLAAGLAPELAGTPLAQPEPPVLPADAPWLPGPAGLLYAQAVVVALDRYGNAVTNARIPPGARDVRVQAPLEFAGPLRRAYGDVRAGEALALVGSSGRVELARREAPSGLHEGDEVLLACRA